MRISLKLKSSIFLAALLLAVVSILSFFVLNGIKEYQKQQYEDYLIGQGEIASNYIKQIYLMESNNHSDEFLNERGQELVKRFEMITGMHVILYNMAGNEIANSRPLSGKTDVSGLLKYALKGINTYMEERDSVIFLSPIYNATEQIGVLQYHYSIVKNKQFYINIKQTFLYASIIIFIISFLCGNLYMNPIIKGILKLKNKTERIETGDFTGTEVLGRTDELGELSLNINNMSITIENQINQMKLEQDKLQVAVEKLELLGDEQKQFIHNVTHEFRTPLTVIKAYADLMYLYNDDVNLMNEAKENIDKESLRLTNMLEKVLTLASLEKYGIELNLEPVDIGEKLNEVCERLQGKVKKYGLQLHTDIENYYVSADQEKLTQIFINLLDNAIKYNLPGGQIWVTCKAQEQVVSIEFKNTGIAIPESDKENVFKPFYTVNKARTGSSGLGLSLVKALVEKQGGTITLKDTNKDDIISFKICFPI